MKIYVVTGEVAYEPSTVIAVFSTEELATDFVNNIKKKNYIKYKNNLNYYNEFCIKKFIINDTTLKD